MARINYVELASADLPAAKRFYQTAFGWAISDYGPSYAATTTGDVDLGLQGEPKAAFSAPLAVIAVENLEATLAAVIAAGGIVTVPIFAFPGGKRFQFRDPNGNELAAWVTE